MKIFDKTSLKISFAYLSMLTGNEYNPCDLFCGIERISNLIYLGIIGEKKNEVTGDFFFSRYSIKCFSKRGSLLARLGPMRVKCSFKMLGIRDFRLVIVLV